MIPYSPGASRSFRAGAARARSAQAVLSILCSLFEGPASSIGWQSIHHCREPCCILLGQPRACKHQQIQQDYGLVTSKHTIAERIAGCGPTQPPPKPACFKCYKPPASKNRAPLPQGPATATMLRGSRLQRRQGLGQTQHALHGTIYLQHALHGTIYRTLSMAAIYRRAVHTEWSQPPGASPPSAARRAPQTTALPTVQWANQSTTLSPNHSAVTKPRHGTAPPSSERTQELQRGHQTNTMRSPHGEALPLSGRSHNPQWRHVAFRTWPHLVLQSGL